MAYGDALQEEMGAREKLLEWGPSQGNPVLESALS